MAKAGDPNASYGSAAQPVITGRREAASPE